MIVLSCAVSSKDGDWQDRLLVFTGESRDALSRTCALGIREEVANHMRESWDTENSLEHIFEQVSVSETIKRLCDLCREAYDTVQDNESEYMSECWLIDVQTVYTDVTELRMTEVSNGL